MTCHVPVDLLQVEPRIWGDLETSQALCLFGAGVLSLTAVTGRLPLLVAILLAAPLATYALLEVDGVPVRRLLPRLARHGHFCVRHAPHLDATLWIGEEVRDHLDHPLGFLHCLVGSRRGR